MRRAAFTALGLALIVQLGWMGGHWLWGDGPGDKLLYDTIIVVAFSALALTRGRLRWLATTVRVLVGIAFLGSVADRFGLLGPAGAPGVSWGDFDHFITYTRSVNAFLPAEWASALAVLATGAETILGTLLVLGFRPRHATAGAALVLLVFGLAMTFSLGPGAQFDYAVAVLATGAWALTTVDTGMVRLGRLRLHHRGRSAVPARS